MDPSASDFMYQQMENILDRKLEFSAAAGPGLFKHERIGRAEKRPLGMGGWGH
jgi:hypothetical protein